MEFSAQDLVHRIDCIELNCLLGLLGRICWVELNKSYLLCTEYYYKPISLIAISTHLL